jgi:hypothetical protein
MQLRAIIYTMIISKWIIIHTMITSECNSDETSAKLPLEARPGTAL